MEVGMEVEMGVEMEVEMGVGMEVEIMFSVCCGKG